MIGDVLASTVICSALKQSLPCEVHYMINSNTYPVVENHPDVDHFILTDPSKNKISDFIKLGKSLQIEKYDAIIDAYGIWESTIPALFSKAPLRIGFKKWYTRFFYNKLITPEEHVSGSAIAHRLQLAAAVSGISAQIDFPVIYLTAIEKAAAKKLIDAHIDKKNALIMISLLGSTFEKSLPGHEMAKVIDLIAEQDSVQFIFNYMPTQEKEATSIYSLCKKETQRKIIQTLYTKNLREFLAVLSFCDALIGNEGGAVNMAKALQVPTFTIFSPWINKASWNMLEDEKKHVAIHLSDFFPEIYKQSHPKKFKSQSIQLYQLLKTELFSERLKLFIGRIVALREAKTL